MRKFSNKEKVNGELACRGLSKKATDFYTGTDPFSVYEYEEYSGEDENGNSIYKKLYAYDGCFGSREGMSFEELQSELEALSDAVSDEE